MDASAEPLGRPLLPDVKLAAGGHSRRLERRLAFLWRAAHALRSSALAPRLSAALLQAASANRAPLPAAVADFLCARCAALLLPSLSADVRVAPEPLASAANRRLERQRRVARRGQPQAAPPERIKSALRVTCKQCGHVNVHAAATVVNRPKSKKSRKRALEEREGDAQSAAKRAKTQPTAKQEPKAKVPVARSVLAPPPSPPRKLLDAKRKKKKKTAGANAASTAKSSLNSFLQGLRPGASN